MNAFICCSILWWYYLGTTVKDQRSYVLSFV